MSAVRFLGDEHIDHDLADALWHREPSIEFRFVGEEGMPPRSSSDLEIVRFAAREKWTIISSDRASMPDAAAEHMAAGGHTFGVILVRRRATWAKLINDLILIWSVCTIEEWDDRTQYLPW